MFSISFNEYNVNDDKILSASPFIFVTPAAILGILTAKFFLNFYFAIISVGILLFTLGFLQVTRQKFNNIRSGALVKIDHFKNILILLALCFSFSIRYHQVASIRPQNYITHYHINGICSVTGTIREAHYYENNNHRYIIDLEKIGFDNKEADKNVKGKILLNTHSIKREFHYGDYIHCYGSLEKPQGQRNPGQFDYSAYLANRDIFYSITIMNPDSIVLLAEQRGNFFFQKIIAPVRKYARQVFFKYLARPGRALLNALILGERHDIEKEVMHDFQRIGVVHVLAISGLHVGFIIIFVLVLFSFLRISYPLKIMLLFLVLSGFIALVNFKAPVIRAVLMVVLFITGNLLERRMNPVQIILASAFIILIIEPREIFDPGFQFSYLAVMTIVYGYFLFNRLLILRFKKTGCYNNRYLAWVIKQILIPFIISLSAVIGTMPLTIYYYGYLPIVSVIVNIFIIPMIGFILILGLFLLLMPGYWDVTLFFIKGVANLINLSVGFLYKITSSINKFSLASIDTPKPPVIVILLIIIVLYLVIFVKRKYLRNILLYLGIIITLIMIISSIKLRTNSIRLTVLDVGHGDAIHLRFPNGNCMLIDGGESSIYKDYGREVVIPFLKQERSLNLQYVVLSHPHKDHLGGLIEVLKVASIDTIILSSYPYNTILFKSFLALAKRKKIYLRYVSCGDQLYPDVNCRIYVLHPSDEFSDTYNFSGSECNNSSIVLKIKYGENSILLTGDIEKDAERSLLKYKDFLESEVLKVAHHGGINSCMMDFLNKVNPLVAVISVGGKNRFNQPADLTLNRLHMVSTAVLQTCNQGAVVLEVGAKEIKKVNWR